MDAGKTERLGVYAGTFDPITVGHLDIITRALSVVDRVFVAVAAGTSKTTMFKTEQRCEMVRTAVAELAPGLRQRIEVAAFEGLLVHYARSVGAKVVIRGLRAVSDYEYEAQMAHINRHLDSELETVFLVTSQHCSFISSSIVKDIWKNNGEIGSLVPSGVEQSLNLKRIEKDGG